MVQGCISHLDIVSFWHDWGGDSLDNTASKKQSVVIQSSIETKFRAMAHSTCEMI